MSDDNPTSIQNFEVNGRYAYFEADDETEAALAEQAIADAGERFFHSGTVWRDGSPWVVAGVYELDELYHPGAHDHEEAVELTCLDCGHEYVGAVAVHTETGDRRANCPRCGETFEVTE